MRTPEGESAVLSPRALEAFLALDPVCHVHGSRAREAYDLLGFGGGSCPKLIGRIAERVGRQQPCFLTNGSDNGGSTQDIVEALFPEYGPTLPVGDITSGLIARLDPFRYELLNLRGWKLDPDRFSAEERQAFGEAVEDRQTFSERVALAIEWYLSSFQAEADSARDAVRDHFCAELMHLARLVDEVGLIRPGSMLDSQVRRSRAGTAPEVRAGARHLPAGLPAGLDLAGASVRHLIFNALMIRVGAYDRQRKTPDPDRFMVGLYLLQEGLGIEQPVFPCSIDQQVLYAEWIDESGQVVWSTKHVDPERPVTAIGGQVALSNAPDWARRLPGGGYARLGRFGFDPDPQPRAYPEALEAIRRLRPGSPILFGPSSFVASVAPCLAIPAIVDELENRSDCVRIVVLNLTLNNETLGWSVSDYLDFWELNTGRPAARTIDYLVVNNDFGSTPQIAEALQDRGDRLETFKFRGPVKVSDDERASIPSRGVALVEAPLAAVSRQLMRLSSRGEREFVWVPSHDPERLAAVCKNLVQRPTSNVQGHPPTPDAGRWTLDAGR